MIERFMTLTGVIESCWKIVMVGSSGEREIKEVVFEYERLNIVKRMVESKALRVDQKICAIKWCTICCELKLLDKMISNRC